MFDVPIERIGWMPPQVPQRKAGAAVDVSMPIVSMFAGTAIGMLTSDAMSPGELAVAGGLVWGATFALGRVSMGEPSDYYGRKNAPSNLAYGALGLLAGIGSTWATSGLWEIFKHALRGPGV
ncbi:MAG: hypothetical protein ACYCPT_02060 [Acidimicrobiales bacterium]